MVECGSAVTPEMGGGFKHVAAEDETVYYIEYPGQKYIGHHPAPEHLYIEISSGEHQQGDDKIYYRKITHYFRHLYP